MSTPYADYKTLSTERFAIQRARGTTAEHSAFTGLDGELTVNTTTKVVHVHDGATEGGLPLDTKFNVRRFGAKADGTDDTDAIQAAIDATPAEGGCIYFPPGTYSIEGTVTIEKQGIKLCGETWFTTTLKKLNNAGVPMVKFTAGQSQIANVRFEESTAATNTACMVELETVSDITLKNVWLYGGYDALLLDRSDNIQITNCLFEGARRHELHAYQSSLLTIVGNTFFGCGLTEEANPAAIKIAKDGGYSFRPNSITITGNYFNYARYSHFIQASNATSLAIVGNYFHLAGMYNPGTKDDINLVSCEYAAVTSNVSTSEYNNYIEGNRASRYCLNIDSGCSKVRVCANAFKPGITGTVNDEGTSTEILASVDGAKSRLPAGIDVGQAIFSGGAAGDVTNPSLIIQNDKIMSFLNALEQPWGAFLQLNTSGVLNLGVDNATRATLATTGLKIGATGAATVSSSGSFQHVGDTIGLFGAYRSPASTATGNVGEFCFDANYFYACVGSNAWKRMALSTY